MTLEEAKQQAEALLSEGKRVIEKLDIERQLGSMGKLHLTGSFRSGLMVKRDIDFYILVDEPQLQPLADLGRKLMDDPTVGKISIANHYIWPKTPGVPRSLYLCIRPVVEGELWQVDVHMMNPDDLPDKTNYPLDWEDKMTGKQKDSALMLKANLQELGRYPGEFRSADIYRAVMNDGIKTIPELQTWRKTHPYF